MKSLVKVFIIAGIAALYAAHFAFYSDKIMKDPVWALKGILISAAIVGATAGLACLFARARIGEDMGPVAVIYCITLAALAKSGLETVAMYLVYPLPVIIVILVISALRKIARERRGAR